jgi:hypothetical protein
VSGPGPASPDATRRTDAWPLADGEIHYLWWYIQGSIMEPWLRQRLRRAWGFCGRHAWGALAVEAAFRHHYLHGPAVLYEDLMQQAARGFARALSRPARPLARILRTTASCSMCEEGYERQGRGAARDELFEQGRDASAFLAFADVTRPHWRATVCGRCAGNPSTLRCRPHLVEEAPQADRAAVGTHAKLVEHILGHLKAYVRSFRWECRGSETDEDRAALISAVGWCSGWSVWLPLLERRDVVVQGDAPDGRDGS